MAIDKIEYMCEVCGHIETSPQNDLIECPVCAKKKVKTYLEHSIGGRIVRLSPDLKDRIAYAKGQQYAIL